MEFTFELNYQLANDDANHDELVERMASADCTDALVGIGQPGRIALEFTREATGLDSAVAGAQADVKKAIPDATLVETSARKAVAAATGRAHESCPLHSRLWLGRPFVLIDETIGWGRYTVPGNGAPALALRSVEPESLARIFAEQLQLHAPESVVDFEREVKALSGPHEPNTALAAVFESARPLHGVDAAQFRYIGPH